MARRIKRSEGLLYNQLGIDRVGMKINSHLVEIHMAFEKAILLYCEHRFPPQVLRKGQVRPAAPGTQRYLAQLNQRQLVRTQQAITQLQAYLQSLDRRVHGRALEQLHAYFSAPEKTIVDQSVHHARQRFLREIRGVLSSYYPQHAIVARNLDRRGQQHGRATEFANLKIPLYEVAGREFARIGKLCLQDLDKPAAFCDRLLEHLAKFRVKESKS